MNTIDFTKLNIQAYLERYPGAENDVEIVQRMLGGESAVALSMAYGVSESTLYRIRRRVLDFATQPDDLKGRYLRLLDDPETEMPIELYGVAFSSPSENVWQLFLLSVFIYVEDLPCVMPRYLVKKKYPGIGNRKQAEKIVEKLAGLRLGTTPVYETIRYDRGIVFEFSEAVKNMLDY